MKKTYLFKSLCIFALIGTSQISWGQVKANNLVTGTIATESAFIDASGFSSGVQNGKGLNFPRTDLTTFTFKTATTSSLKFPTAYDGMVVYNTGTGNTLTGTVVAVTPGFYYYSNPGATTNSTTGTWTAFLSPAKLALATSVSNTLTGANLSTTVNGVKGADVDLSTMLTTALPLATSVSNTLTGANLSTTVNGVTGANVNLVPAIAAATTNTLGVSGSTLTSTVNGVAGSVNLAPAIAASTTVSNTISGANLSTTVNGVTGANVDLAPAIAAATTVSNTFSGSLLSTTVNGVSGTAVDIASAVASATTNTLGLAGNTLTSTVNGKVATSPAVSSVLNSVSGGFLYTTVNTISSPGISLSAIVPDATITVKGIVQLAGDLTGTAALPTVAVDAITSAKILDLTIATADIANNAVTVAKLPTGATATTFLRGDGTWVNPTATVISAIVRKTAAYSVLATDHTVLCDATTAGFTLTLPAVAESTGVEYIIRKTDETNNVVTFSTSIKVSETTSISDVNYTTTLHIQSDGTSWWLIE